LPPDSFRRTNHALSTYRQRHVSFAIRARLYSATGTRVLCNERLQTKAAQAEEEMSDKPTLKIYSGMRKRPASQDEIDAMAKRKLPRSKLQRELAAQYNAELLKRD